MVMDIHANKKNSEQDYLQIILPTSIAINQNVIKNIFL